MSAGIPEALDSTRWRGVHTRVAVTLGIAWLLCSFEVALIGAVLPTIQEQWALSEVQGVSLVAVWLVGILIGAQAAGVLSDRFGRKKPFMATLLLYATFTLLSAFSTGYEMLMVLRLLTAIGVGAEYSAINATISEFIPARSRGRTNAAVMSCWGLGALLAAGVGAVVLNLFPDEYGWRLGFGLGAVMALVALAVRSTLPESPRWLLRRGDDEKARRVAAQVVGQEVAPDAPRRAGEGCVEGRASVWRLLRRAPRQSALGGALDFAEASGYYGLLYAFFPVLIVGAVGIPAEEVPRYLLWGSVGVVAGGPLVTLLMDRFSRTQVVASAYCVAALGVVALAAAAAAGNQRAVLFALVFASASATAAWVSAYPTFTEQFPTDLRSTGVGFSVAVGRVGAAISALGLAGIAGAMNLTVAMALLAGFWLLGAAAMLLWSLGGGHDGAGASLEQLEPEIGRNPTSKEAITNVDG